ncbi:hypothetical protein BJY01DRAFT_252766 [Aspergillus pseudoustus]|uniref:K Homology domain-containing protein n=1 Tax=Aspergillus pseudoustus TaxID=1810923 RepID=A0ABR4J639_9EURO
MAEIATKSESLAAVGRHVIDGFSTLCRNIAAVNRKRVVNEKQRFSLWASSLGLYHTGHSSLDYRFRDSPPLFKFALGLLNDLKETLAILNEPVNRDVDEISISDDSSSEEDLSSYPLENAIDEYLFNISITVDRLYGLSFRIRNPALRTGLSRALSFTKVNKDTGVDLIASLAKWDLKCMIDVFRPWWKDVGQNDIESHFLVQRLATANTHRRQQFQYWARRKAKYDGAHHAAIEDSEKAATPSQIGDVPRTRGQLSEPTTATAIPTKVMAGFDGESVASKESLVIQGGESGDAFTLPPPPNIDPDQKEFECPYCFILCNRKTLEPKAWERHLIKDLRPYICTFAGCREPDQQYDTRPDWISHEYSKHGYQPQDSRACPFCLKNAVNAEHIANHMRRIASFALPSLDRNPDTTESKTGGHVDSLEVASDGDSTDRSIKDEWADTVKAIHMVLKGHGVMKVGVRPGDSTESYFAESLRDFFGLATDTEFIFQDTNGTEIPIEYDSLYNDMTIFVRLATSSPALASSIHQDEDSQAEEPLATEDGEEIQTQNISIPADMVGCIIGRAGSKITEIRRSSGARISIAKAPHDETGERMFTIVGSAQAAEKALYLFYENLEAEKTRRSQLQE